MSSEILRAVFDCNIFIQTLLNPNSVAAADDTANETSQEPGWSKVFRLREFILEV